MVICYTYDDSMHMPGITIHGFSQSQGPTLILDMYITFRIVFYAALAVCTFLLSFYLTD